MKQSIKRVICCLSLYGVVSLASIISPNGNRMWDTVLLTESELDIIESKVDFVSEALFSDVSTTVTTLNNIFNQSCSAESVVDSAFMQTSSILQDFCTLDSFIDVLGNTVESIENTIQLIHIDDFGGTWTAIDDVQEVLCSKADNLYTLINMAESKVDYLINQDINNFSLLLSELELISGSLVSTLTTVEYIQDTLTMSFGDINTLLQTAKSLSQSISIKLSAIDTELTEGFIATFTTFNVLQNKMYAIESVMHDIDIIISLDGSTVTTTLLALLQTICTIESKIDAAYYCTSLIDPAIATIDSKSDVHLSKICFIDSSIDILNVLTQTINSKVDFIGKISNTIVSQIDAVDIVTVLSKVCAIDSNIDIIGANIINTNTIIDSIISKEPSLQLSVGTLDSYIDTSIEKLDTIISKIDIVRGNINTSFSRVAIVDSYVDIAQSKLNAIDETGLFSKICRADSQIDRLDSKVDYLNRYTYTLSSKIDAINTQESVLDSLIDIILFKHVTIGSGIDYIDSVIDISMMKACTILSNVDIVSSKIDVNITNASRLQSQLDSLHVNFQQTWTVLQAIQNQVRTASNTVVTINSKTDQFLANPFIDISATFTALAALDRLTMTIQSKMDFANTTASRLDCIKQSDLNGTYSMLDTMNIYASLIAAKSSSRVDIIIDLLDNYGTPLYQSDIGITGTFLSEEGSYFLAENIVFDPSSDGLAAITISVDNVTLNMLRRTVSLIGSKKAIDGVRIAQDVGSVTINDGSIRDFSGNGVETIGYSNGIFLNNMNIMGVYGNGIDIAQSCTAISIQNSMVASSRGDGVNVNNSSSITVHNCLLTDNGLSTTNNGLTINNSDRVFVSYCMSTTNKGDGFCFISSTTNQEIELYGNKSFKNGRNGIYMGHIFYSIIENCICSENSANGIGIYDCQYIDIANNYCMENSIDGIFLGTDFLGTSSCYVHGNSLLITGSVNLREGSGSGPNNILSNLALSVSGGNNYATESQRSYLNFITVDQSGAFPITDLIKWYNISMTT